MAYEDFAKLIKKCPFLNCDGTDLEFHLSVHKRDLTLISCLNCNREFTIVESPLACSNEHAYSIRYPDLMINTIFYRCFDTNCFEKRSDFFDFESRKIERKLAQDLLKIKPIIQKRIKIGDFEIRPKVTKYDFENKNLEEVKSILIYSLDMYNEVYNPSEVKRSHLGSRIHDLKYSNLKNDSSFTDKSVDEFFRSVKKLFSILDLSFDRLIVVPESDPKVNSDNFLRKLAVKISREFDLRYSVESITYVPKVVEKTKNAFGDNRTNSVLQKFNCDKIEEKSVLLLDDVIQTGSTMVALNNKIKKSNPKAEIFNLALVRTGMT
jgi:predicted amidophosphoribosyltransferase